MNKLIITICLVTLAKISRAQEFLKSSFNAAVNTGYVNDDYIGSNQVYIVGVNLSFTRLIGFNAEYQYNFTDRIGARGRIGLTHYSTKFNYDYTTIGPMPPVGEVYEQTQTSIFNLSAQMQLLYALNNRFTIYILGGFEQIVHANATVRTNLGYEGSFPIPEEEINNAFVGGLGLEYLMVYSKKHRFSVFLDGLVRTQPLCNDCIPLTEANENPQPFGLHLGLRYQFVMN